MQEDGRLVMEIGTLCSGSEIMLTILPHWQNAMSRLLGIRVEVRHMWCCEADEDKRLWIKANFDTEVTYVDVTKLDSPEGGFDTISGNMSSLSLFSCWWPGLAARMRAG